MRPSTVHEVIPIVMATARRFKNLPRDAFLGEVTEWISARMTLREASMVLGRAAETLDHFPSISQLKEISDRFQREKPSGTAHGRSRYSDVEEESTPRLTPWPLAIEAMMTLMDGDTALPDDKREKAFTGARRYNNVSEADAWDLFDAFKAKRFDDEKALSIIARVEKFQPRRLNEEKKT